jgi:hypothetical protein
MTMTLLTVVKDVCSVIGVTQPSSVFSGITANRTMQEIVSLANEMAQRIAYDLRDWTVMKKVTDPEMTGDGTTTAFNLPSDFKRMLLTTNVWRSNSGTTPMTFIPDLDEWTRRRFTNATDTSWGEWTIYGGQIHIFPALAVDETASFTYLNKYCITLAGGGVSDVFVSDTDTFLLDERVLKLGMIWQWKAQKGSPYAEDMGTYGDALTNAMGHDSPSPIIFGKKIIRSASWLS